MLENATSAVRSSGSAERSALVADALHRGGGSPLRVRLRVHGESMLPTLWPGDLVEIAHCSPEELRTGEIVLAMREGRFFLHRLVAPCMPNGFLLRGDSMPAPDPLYPHEALVGRLVRNGAERPDPGAKWFGVAWFGKTWCRALGMLFCHFSFARRVALRLHIRRKASAHEFRDLEQTADMSSSEFGAC